MSDNFDYFIIGAGIAGASAVEGIRDVDKNSSIKLMGAEAHLPYHRPPLTKNLWSGKKKVEDIFVHDESFYKESGVELQLGAKVGELNVRNKKIRTTTGKEYGFKKLLIATGGTPKTFPAPGGNLPGICYFRTLDDYQAVRKEAAEGKSAVIVGGGFIGSEMAGSLASNGLKVTMMFQSSRICRKVFPNDLSAAVEREYEEKGVTFLRKTVPVSFEKKGKMFRTRTSQGSEVVSDIVIVGLGITPSSDLAGNAGLNTGDGIVVNEYLQTSHPDVYAAGDNAFFPYKVLGQSMRVEHWDNAQNQGKYAGRNMAGAGQAYDYMPYFFSDLMDFGYEAVGEVDSGLDTVADWRQPNQAGIIYYARGGRIRGAMMCNVRDKVDVARQLIIREASLEEGGGKAGLSAA